MEDQDDKKASTSKSGNKNANTVKLIKALQSKIERLEKDNSTLRNDMSKLQQQNNDLLTGESYVPESGSVPQPNAVNEEIASLTKSNDFLRKQLEGRQKKNADELLEKEEFQNAIKQYRELIAQKNAEIAALKTQSPHGQLTQNVSKLTAMLDRARSANRIFAEQIETLQSELREMNVQVHAPSDDVNGGCTPGMQASKQEVMELQDQVEKFRLLNVDMQGQLNAAVNEKKFTQSQLEEIEKQNGNLQQQVQDLQVQIRSLQDNPANQEDDDSIIQSQLKVFMEDFNAERQEKEALLQEKGRITGENTTLKRQLSRLMNELQVQNYQSSPYPSVQAGSQYSTEVSFQRSTRPMHQSSYEYNYSHPAQSNPASPPFNTQQQQQQQPAFAPGPEHHPAQMHSQTPPTHNPAQPRRIGFPQSNTSGDPGPVSRFDPRPTTVGGAYNNSSAAAVPFHGEYAPRLPHPQSMRPSHSSNQVNSDQATPVQGKETSATATKSVD